METRGESSGLQVASNGVLAFERSANTSGAMMAAEEVADVEHIVADDEGLEVGELLASAAAVLEAFEEERGQGVNGHGVGDLGQDDRVDSDSLAANVAPVDGAGPKGAFGEAFSSSKGKCKTDGDKGKTKKGSSWQQTQRKGKGQKKVDGKGKIDGMTGREQYLQMREESRQQMLRVPEEDRPWWAPWVIGPPFPKSKGTPPSWL